MKKSCMLSLALCGAVALLVAPALAVADTYVFPSPANNNQGLGNYRDISAFTSSILTIMMNDPGIETIQQELPAAAQVTYTPTTSTSPGWSFGRVGQGLAQITYVINLPSPTGGNPFDPTFDSAELMHGANAVSGLLVLYNGVTSPRPAFIITNRSSMARPELP